MQVVDSIAGARATFGASKRPLGLVATMGALHDGHAALIHAARARCRTVAVSVFVNPLQFGPSEDLERYPRNLQSDLVAAEAAGADAVFAPDLETMYPGGFATGVDVGDIGTRYEGAIRPAHFRGVATVVLKLINVVQPDVLFLGQKDAQQTAVVRQLVRDLDVDVRVEIVATVRENDGLALSSRNVYLSPRERAAAPSLQQALRTLRAGLEGGQSKDAALRNARSVLSSEARLDYLDLVDADSFEPLAQLRAPAFLIGAARFGQTRLLDNIWIPQ